MTSQSIEILKHIYKECIFIFKQCENNISLALKDEARQRAIFMALINIKEEIKRLENSNDTELINLFNKEDLRRISATRNFAAHDSKNMNLKKVENVIKYDLVRVAKESINILKTRLKINKKEKNIKNNKFIDYIKYGALNDSNNTMFGVILFFICFIGAGIVANDSNLSSFAIIFLFSFVWFVSFIVFLFIRMLFGNFSIQNYEDTQSVFSEFDGFKNANDNFILGYTTGAILDSDSYLGSSLRSDV